MLYVCFNCIYLPSSHILRIFSRQVREKQQLLYGNFSENFFCGVCRLQQFGNPSWGGWEPAALGRTAISLTKE